MKNLVEKRAIVARYQSAAPVLTVPIARALGLLVYQVPNWDDTISGMIIKSAEFGGPSGFAVYVNQRHPEKRRRFTIAHEIAHYVLHESIIGDGITDDGLYRSHLGGQIETQANQYAADILMPWNLINDATERGLTDVASLADYFRVSKTAMSIQLGVPD